MDTVIAIFGKRKAEILEARLGLKPNTPLEPRSLDRHEYRVAGTDDLLRVSPDFNGATLYRRHFAKDIS